MSDTDRSATGSGADQAGAAADRFGETARGIADSMREGAERARDAFQEHVVEPARRAGEAARASGQRIADDGSALGTKVIDQAEANAREAFAAMRAAAGARDPAEIMRIQADYLREQGQRSMAQAREVGEMIARFGQDALGTPRAAGDKPSRP